MKPNVMLIVTSLLSVVRATIHLADDVVIGFEPGGVSMMTAVLIVVLWLCATLLLAERRSGYVMLLVLSLLGAAIPIVHMRGRGLHAAIATYSGGFRFVWTLLALGVTTIFAFMLSAQALWSMRSRPPGSPT